MTEDSTFVRKRNTISRYTSFALLTSLSDMTSHKPSQASLQVFENTKYQNVRFVEPLEKSKKCMHGVDKLTLERMYRH
jgi:hypothetical protein